MPSKKSKKKKKMNSVKKRPLEHVAPLYSEDIGTAGIKKPRTSSSMDHQHHVAVHELRMDDDEEYRRKLREVRKETRRRNLPSDTICGFCDKLTLSGPNPMFII